MGGPKKACDIFKGKIVQARGRNPELIRDASPTILSVLRAPILSIMIRRPKRRSGRYYVHNHVKIDLKYHQSPEEPAALQREERRFYT